MKKITIRIPAQPHMWDIAKAIADRKDIDYHPFTPMEIPEMSYPEIKFRPTSLKAFMSLILP